MSSEKYQAAKLAVKLGGFAVLMFTFAFWVMPPLYTLLCEVTGLRKVGGAYEAVDMEIDTSRTITVQFVATQNHDMPWEFGPTVRRLEVHPGEQTVVNYRAFNRGDGDMVGQAVPSIIPFNAVNYFHKIECFCFENQPLAAGESAEMGLLFVVDQDLPADVRTITLSYTLFDNTERAKNRAAAL